MAPIYIRDSEDGSGQRTDERIAGVNVSNFNQSATSITPVVKNVKVQNPDGTFTKGKLYTQSYKHLPQPLFQSAPLLVDENMQILNGSQ